jgi:hypothetical protein
MQYLHMISWIDCSKSLGMKERVAGMTAKIARLVPLATFLWGHLKSLEYSEKVRDVANLQHRITQPAWH